MKAWVNANIDTGELKGNQKAGEVQEGLGNLGGVGGLKKNF